LRYAVRISRSRSSARASPSVNFRPSVPKTWGWSSYFDSQHISSKASPFRLQAIRALSHQHRPCDPRALTSTLFHGVPSSFGKYFLMVCRVLLSWFPKPWMQRGPGMNRAVKHRDVFDPSHCLIESPLPIPSSVAGVFATHRSDRPNHVSAHTLMGRLKSAVTTKLLGSTFRGGSCAQTPLIDFYISILIITDVRARARSRTE
jgi:hypothetical protein